MFSHKSTPTAKCHCKMSAISTQKIMSKIYFILSQDKKYDTELVARVMLACAGKSVLLGEKWLLHAQ